jgi:hypothetical protein
MLTHVVGDELVADLELAPREALVEQATRNGLWIRHNRSFRISNSVIDTVVLYST